MDERPFRHPFPEYGGFIHIEYSLCKNWSGRNKVTETSSRLHPLWPQNRWLYTPRTTDYRHTRQDRWIQTELVSALAKNATKQNPFEIIPLQTTRKENNWKTEEALARAAVTVETERIKGSNPWWWWWWWWCKKFSSTISLARVSKNSSAPFTSAPRGLTTHSHVM